MVYLAITIQAAHEWPIRSMAPLDEEMLASIEYAAAQTIAYQIEKQYQLESDRQGKRSYRSIDQEQQTGSAGCSCVSGYCQIISGASQSSIKLAQELINFCSMRLHPMIKIDELLINELSNHLDYAIFRLKHHIPIRNAYLRNSAGKICPGLPCS